VYHPRKPDQIGGLGCLKGNGADQWPVSYCWKSLFIRERNCLPSTDGATLLSFEVLTKMSSLRSLILMLYLHNGNVVTFNSMIQVIGQRRCLSSSLNLLCLTIAYKPGKELRFLTVVCVPDIKDYSKKHLQK
jgi:hypothetical protein